MNVKTTVLLISLIKTSVQQTVLEIFFIERTLKPHLSMVSINLTIVKRLNVSFD